ncbi:MAG: hypothetical protein KDE04_05920, partial [Anaerolineales bacterium]|nr:hypothetical protein [Anaerolineales bacterium]
MFRQKSPVVLGLIALLALLVLAPAGQTSRAQAAPTHFVEIAATDIAAARTLDLNPILAVDYSSFQRLELDSDDLNRLEISGVPYVLDETAGILQVGRYQFDPAVAGEPALPAGMRAADNQPGFRFVQFTGPTNDAWLDSISAAGMPILQYYPHYTYLVWDEGRQLSGLESSPFIRWTGLLHPAYKQAEELDTMAGRISNVDVMFYNDGNIGRTLNQLEALGAEILNVFPAQPDQAFFDAIVRLDAGQLDRVAQINTVLWLGYSGAEPILDDEMSDQIVAGNTPGNTPVVGYNAHLADLGVDGSGVIWAIIDTGVDYDHPDLNGHIAGGFNYPGAPSDPLRPGDDC